jgi:hypothetical protein
MKIAFIGNFTQIYHEEGKARSLARLGHDVYRFAENTFNNEDVEEIISLNVDLLIYAKLNISIDKKDFLQKMGQHGIKRVCWHPDLMFNTEKERWLVSNPTYTLSDYIFTSDGGHQKDFKKLGLNHYCIRQAIYDKCCYRSEKELMSFKDVEIIFVGGSSHVLHSHRKEFLTILSDKFGNKFRHVGTFDEEWRNDALNDLFNSVSIVIGDSVYSPYYWSNRLYETIGRGAFIIHNKIEGIEDEYAKGLHFDTYENGNYDDLISKIELHLQDTEELKKQGVAGMEYTRRNHTLMNRAQQVISIIERRK